MADASVGEPSLPDCTAGLALLLFLANPVRLTGLQPFSNQIVTLGCIHILIWLSPASETLVRFEADKQS